MVSNKTLQAMVQAALAEDCGSGDITAALLPEGQQAQAQIKTREAMVLCGVAWVDEVFKQLDPTVQIQWHTLEGAAVPADTVLCTLQGNTQQLLTGERTALNFLQTLSAVATQTARYVQAVQGTGVAIVDTRKTLPGWRQAQKYAVRCGGGVNHRMGLYDAFLIKENHIQACGSIATAIEKARSLHPDKLLQVEVESLEELQQALAAKPDMVLLDNFSLEMLQQAVDLNQGQVPLEASGGLDLAQVQQVAQTGVDRISLGALTKHIQAIDLSMVLL